MNTNMEADCLNGFPFSLDFPSWGLPSLPGRQAST
jgi:hypothetical protein